MKGIIMNKKYVFIGLFIGSLVGILTTFWSYVKRKEEYKSDIPHFLKKEWIENEQLSLETNKPEQSPIQTINKTKKIDLSQYTITIVQD